MTVCYLKKERKKKKKEQMENKKICFNILFFNQALVQIPYKYLYYSRKLH